MLAPSWPNLVDTRGFKCENNLKEVMAWDSFPIADFYLWPLLQCQVVLSYYKGLLFNFSFPLLLILKREITAPPLALFSLAKQYSNVNSGHFNAEKNMQVEYLLVKVFSNTTMTIQFPALFFILMSALENHLQLFTLIRGFKFLEFHFIFTIFKIWLLSGVQPRYLIPELSVKISKWGLTESRLGRMIYL